MWQRFHLKDVRTIIHWLGMLVVGSIAIMLPALIVALIYQEWEPATRYFTAIGAALSGGSLMRLVYINPDRLTRQQAAAVTGLAWVVLSIFAAIPLYFSGHYFTYFDSLFDAVSAFTSTGACVILDLDHLSNADNMMRFMMALSGGLGLIVVALSLGMFGKGTGTSLFKSEGRSEHVVPNVVQATRFILRVSVIIVLVATFVLVFMLIGDGLSLDRAILHAFWLAITSFSTAGLAPMSQSIMYYNSLAIEVVCMVVMIMGAISFTLYHWAWKGRPAVFFQDIEIKTGVIWLGIMTIFFTLSLAYSQNFNTLPELLHRGTFMIISAFSTTGLSVLTSNQINTVFTNGAFIILCVIMCVGGCSGSTAGGIKIDRIGIILKSFVQTIKQTISPDSACVNVQFYHAGKKTLSPEIVKNAMTIFIMYVITYGIGALAGIAHGYDALQAIFESIAVTSNSGLSTGIITSGMPVSLEFIYMLQMWAGRLEFIAFIALIVQILVSMKPQKRILKKRTPAVFKKKFIGKNGVACLVAIALVATTLSGCSPASDQLVLADSSAEKPKLDNTVNPSISNDSSFIYDTTISELTSATANMDGETVQIKGEAIGEIRACDFDDSHYWVTLQEEVEGNYSTAMIYVSDITKNLIDAYGKYAQKGTILQIRGEFHVSCNEHDGLSDIHAVAAEKVQSGQNMVATITPSDYMWGFLFLLVGGILWVLYFGLKRRKMNATLED